MALARLVRQAARSVFFDTLVRGARSGPQIGSYSVSWTKDVNGAYVAWNQPPHYVNGRLNLLLPGERYILASELAKRRREYLRLARRALKNYYGADHGNV